MEKNNFVLVLAIVVILVVFIAVSSDKGTDPLMQQLLTQQTEILKNQNKMTGGSADVEVLARLKALETRVEKMENSQLDAIKKLLADANGGNAKPAAPARPAEDYDKVHQIDVAHTPIYGKKDAPVTIVEFVDFECPFCARFHPPMFEAVKAYKGKVNYMIKNFPLSFHPNARSAAKAAFAAGEQGKYFEMAELLLQNGRSLSDAKYIEFAQKIGLNVDKFKKDLKEKNGEYEKRISADMSLGGNVGVRGTPTFFINGKKTRARDLDSYKREIDEILKK